MFIFNIIFSIIHLLLFLLNIYFIPDTIIIENTSGLMNVMDTSSIPSLIDESSINVLDTSWTDEILIDDNEISS